MQAVTLDVIMAGVFGIESSPPRGHRRAKDARHDPAAAAASTNPTYQLIELQNAARTEPRGVLKALLGSSTARSTP